MRFVPIVGGGFFFLLRVLGEKLVRKKWCARRVREKLISSPYPKLCFSVLTARRREQRTGTARVLFRARRRPKIYFRGPLIRGVYTSVFFVISALETRLKSRRRSVINYRVYLTRPDGEQPEYIYVEENITGYPGARGHAEKTYILGYNAACSSPFGYIL